MTEIKLPPLVGTLADLPERHKGVIEAYGQACATAAIEPYAKRIAELEAARIAYASEFPLNKDGEPDVCRVHENIRKLKADRQARGEPVAWKDSVEAAKNDALAVYDGACNHTKEAIYYVTESLIHTHTPQPPQTPSHARTRATMSDT